MTLNELNPLVRYYIEVEFQVHNPEKKELLSALLADFGFDGVEELSESVKGYIQPNQFNADDLTNYLNRFNDIKGIKFSHTKLPDKNWNEAWEKSYEPVVISSKVRIRASFHPPSDNFLHDILIDPKMSFGTGHHESTQLMMEMMLGMDFNGKGVLDFGSGTGVLSILAHKMKASSVIAIDIDEWAFENVKENIRINHAENIEARLGDASVIPDKKFEITLANVNKNIISENMESLACSLINKGIILFSGLLVNDENDVVKAARNSGFLLNEKKTKNEWLCLKFTKL